MRDTGTGIAAEELPQLFERFRRVEGARGRTLEGSGIGLALVQELVKLHGGTIHVAESEPGRGRRSTCPCRSVRRISPAEQLDAPGRRRLRTNLRAQAYLDEAMRWLPRQRTGERDAASSADDVDLQATGASAQRSRILLADDNADMRDYVRRLLGEHYEVEVVADGQPASPRRCDDVRT